MRLVVGIGGNALVARGEEMTVATERRHVSDTARSLLPLVRSHQVVITHGNGPQVGALAQESDEWGSASTPLDVLVAQTQGSLGYLLLEALEGLMPDLSFGALLTEVIVDPHDRAFARWEKFIGPNFLSTTEVVARHPTWHFERDNGTWRRVVPSPSPRSIVPLPAIRALLEAGTTVICAGGGGVPVALDGRGRRRGVEAVLDKDLTSSLLASELKADALLILCDVAGVIRDFGTEQAQLIKLTSPDKLREMHFAPGSMGPKVDAVCRFVEETGRPAYIGASTSAADVLAGLEGTCVSATGEEPAR